MMMVVVVVDVLDVLITNQFFSNVHHMHYKVFLDLQVLHAIMVFQLYHNEDRYKTGEELKMVDEMTT